MFTGPFVYISPQFADELRSQNVFEGDLVFPHRGSIGEVGIVSSELPRYVLSTSLMKLTCDRSKAEPLYLFYFFRSEAGRHEILQYASTVGTPGIGQPLTSLRAMKVPLPSLGEQRVIAHALGSLDDKIDLNRRTNETLEAMARTLFRSWFVDFDPVRAKVDGRPPEGLNAKTAGLFPDSFDDSPLGPIPMGWRVVPLPEVIEVNPRRSQPKGVVAPYLDMGNMPTASARATQWEMREGGSGARFANGDVLLARITPCLGRID